MGFFSKKKASAKPQEMMAKAKRLEELARSCEDSGALDFFICKDEAATDWEIALAIRVSEEQQDLFLKSRETMVSIGMMALTVQDILLPIFLVRLNDDKRLSFACLARYDLVGKGSGDVLESLDYFDILSKQERLSLYFSLPNGGSTVLSPTNQLKRSPYLTQIASQIDELLAALVRKRDNNFAISSARLSLESMAMQKNWETGKEQSFGDLMWERYEKGN
jgi:hypothetical protein